MADNVKEPPSSTSAAEPWLLVCGAESPQLEIGLSKEVAAKVGAKKFSPDDIDYVAKLKLPLVDGALAVSDEDLEQLRRLCQLWDVELLPFSITSHRPIIGPIIVAFKKLLIPFMRAILKDTLKRQRDFNAATISLFAEMMQRNHR